MKLGSSLKLTAFAMILTLASSALADCTATADKILAGKDIGLSQKLGTFSKRKEGVRTGKNTNDISKDGDHAVLDEKKDGTTVITFSGGRDYMAERKDFTITLSKSCKITEVSGESGISQEKFKINPAVCALPKIDELSKKPNSFLDGEERPKTKQIQINGGIMPQQDWSIVPKTCGRYRGMFADVKDTKPVGTVKDGKSSGTNKSGSAK